MNDKADPMTNAIKKQPQALSRNEVLGILQDAAASLLDLYDMIDFKKPELTSDALHEIVWYARLQSSLADEVLDDMDKDVEDAEHLQ